MLAEILGSTGIALVAFCVYFSAVPACSTWSCEQTILARLHLLSSKTYLTAVIVKQAHHMLKHMTRKTHVQGAVTHLIAPTSLNQKLIGVLDILFIFG